MAKTGYSFESLVQLAESKAASSINLTAGDGLSGGGNLTANRTFNVDSSVIRTTGNQTICGTKSFCNCLQSRGSGIRLDIGEQSGGSWTFRWGNDSDSNADEAGIRFGGSNGRTSPDFLIRNAGDSVRMKLTSSGVMCVNTVCLTASQNSNGAAATRKDYVDNCLSGSPLLVRTSGNQTIGGTKTFSSNPLSTATQNTSACALTRKDYVDGCYNSLNSNKADKTTAINTGDGLSGGGNLSATRCLCVDSTVIRTTGNQTLGGLKTFSSNPVSTATQSTSTCALTRKCYVDACVSSAVSGKANSSITLTAGDGLSGGGNLTANRTFNVDSTVIRTTGNQTLGGVKTFSSNPVSTATQSTSVCALTRKDYVDGCVNVKANSSITLTAGDGLSGGGNLTANRTFNVDSSVIRTTGTQTISGTKCFTVTQCMADYIRHIGSCNQAFGFFDTTQTGIGANTGNILLRPRGIGSSSCQVCINSSGQILQTSAQGTSSHALTKKCYVDACANNSTSETITFFECSSGASSGTVCFQDGLSNYDMLLVVGKARSYPTSGMMPTSLALTLGQVSVGELDQTGTATHHARITSVTEATASINRAGSGLIYGVYGIKYNK